MGGVWAWYRHRLASREGQAMIEFALVLGMSWGISTVVGDRSAKRSWR
jgi:hypothetical protein